ncbi:uncoordinated isoform X2 [Musca autumnalis]|uniref:uncoordinated isoform X2 n=1 Tax=Musca autumnalis TaxID=221902 RepID=UPI003CF25648
MSEACDTGAKKVNLADLSNIPANEFEKHFHEWMERDDVARALQAKLRCDLIQNFNKTNLALNTLVAEFLYAQNCHFTLSVFCTEIPFRNTLPDFESMRHYRFNEREINDIWEAVTGTAATKRCLDSAILEEYETDITTSLLLLILKSLLNMKPPEMLHKTVEIQTDGETHFHYQQKQSISVQTTTTPKSPAKSAAKSPDNLRLINKYLLILSQKVNEMTREFEMLIKQRNLKRPNKPRSREFQTLNKSLERINENVKQLTKCKPKGKRLTNVVESIDNLTKQFGKCAESFGQVTRELAKREKQSGFISHETPKQNSQEKHTETEIQEKSYSEWIHEMRTTENGKKFLERVEHSLSKALAKHKEKWENENEIKMKQMKTFIKLHYKQKMLTLLSRQSSDEQTNEARKLNETIEMKLKNFETKQMELLEKLQESSFELQEAQKALQEKANNQKDKPHKSAETPVNVLESDQKLENNDITNLNHATPHLNNKTNLKDIKEVNINKPIDTNDGDLITPRDHNIERIINEAKIRLKQLETEGNCLEKHFQNYLERRRKENQCREETTKQLIQQSQTKTSEILSQIGTSKTTPPNAAEKRLLFRSQSKSFPIQEDDLDLDEEFLKLKEKLTTAQTNLETTTHESSPSIELKNAILDAKEKFFENEQLFRERKERELMKECASSNQRDDAVDNPLSFWNSSLDFESQMDIGKCTEREQIIVFNINNSVENNDERIKTQYQETPVDDKINELVTKSGTIAHQKKSPRRELFPSKESKVNARETIRRNDSLPSVNTNLRQTLKDLKTYTQSLDMRKDKSEGNSEDLIKQSMAKMKQLFEENTKEKTKLRNTLESITNVSKNASTSGTTYGERTLMQTTSEEDPNGITKTGYTSGTVSTFDYTGVSTYGAGHLNQNTLDLNLTTNTNTTISASPTSLVSVDGNLKEDLNTNKTTTTPEETIETQLNMPLLMKPLKNNIPMPPPLQLTTSDSEEDSLKSNTKENQDSAAGISEISSDEDIIMPPSGKDMPKLVLTTNKQGDTSLEIGEARSEAHPVFIALPRLSISESSENTDPAYDGAMDKKELSKKSHVRTSDESEGDFWA